jgi:hypothetical protein
MKLKLILLVLAVVSISGCAKTEEMLPNEDETIGFLSDEDEQIAFNLLSMGDADPALLIGSWKPVRVAYTADGNKISDVADILSDFALCMSDACTSASFSYDDERLGHLYFRFCAYSYSRSGNLISLIGSESHCFQIYLPYTEDDRIISYALQSACSFVVQGDELIIHFTGDKDKNLLFFKSNKL